MKTRNKFKVAVGVGLLYLVPMAYACVQTFSVPCAKGNKWTNKCAYPNQNSTWTYTLSDGQNVNDCVTLAQGQSGLSGCATDAQVQCTQTYTYTACPGTTPGSGSVSNPTTPSHAVPPNCP